MSLRNVYVSLNCRFLYAVEVTNVPPRRLSDIAIALSAGIENVMLTCVQSLLKVTLS